MSAGQLLLGLLTATLKAGVLLALAAGLVAALKRAPARVRHGIWAGALIGALLVPALSPWVPDWSIAALPLPTLSDQRPVPAAVVSGPSRSDRRHASGGWEPATPTEIGERTRGAGVAGGAAGRGGRAADISPESWLLFAWLLGCLGSLGWFLRALLSARRLERGAVEAQGVWLLELAEACRRVGVRRPVSLLHSPAVARPMTWGSLRPVILLPASARGWSRERRRIVLWHELVHIRRADWPVRLLARLVCSAYWLNPLAWLAARRLAVEQELACDEEVVALGARPSCYARHLLAIARSLGPATPTPAHALDMARRSQMEGRLMSILDARRLRGGRKLAIPALLLIAGLVPALAAIEPWVGEQQTPASAEAEQPARSTPSGDTAGVARVLGELEALERRMEPFEAELEGLELELEPIERELEGIEVEMEPVEVELEGFAAELEPFEAMIEAVEVEMEPHQARLEAIEAELEPFEERLEALELEMEPFQSQLEAIEVELEPFEELLESIAVEMEPLELELEALSEQLEPPAEESGGHSAEMERLTARMQVVHQRMEPFLEKMSATHREMKPVYGRMSDLHRQLEPMYERLQGTHAEMRPIFDRMNEVHREMKPLHERLSEIHQQMAPVYERMGAVHERMSPFHQRMGEHHERLEPYHRKMGGIHERMRPLYEEMGQRHRDLERELVGVVERMLARELVGVTAADTDYAPAAARVVDAVSLRVEDGTLRVMTSAPQLRDILGETLDASRVGTEQEFAAAADRFVRALGDLEIAALAGAGS